MGSSLRKDHHISPEWNEYFAVKKAIDADTDHRKLKLCVADLRGHYTNFNGGIDEINEEHMVQLSPGDIHRLFVLTLVYQNQRYPIYANEEVYVCDLMDVLSNKLSILTKQEASTAYLSTIDGQRTFELDDCIGFWPDELPEAVVQIRETTTYVNVKTLTSNFVTLQVPVNLEESVENLKRRIFFLDGVPFYQQRLIFAGQTLENGHHLSDYHLCNQATIHMIISQGDNRRVVRVRRPANPNKTDEHFRAELFKEIEQFQNEKNEQSN